MKNKFVFITLVILLITMSMAAQKTNTFTDSRDKKTYKTVVIGTQTWMAENLAYKAESGCYAYNDDQNNVVIYGYLYKWETAKNVCPSGWHLPNDAEWNTLIDFLGGGSAASGKLKESDTTHWTSSDKSVTNETGFTALPGGNLGSNGTYHSIRNNGGWWSSTENDVNSAWYRNISSKYNVSRYSTYKTNGFSVRCISDNKSNDDDNQPKKNIRK